MPRNYLVLRGFLYTLLFLCFLSLGTWQPVAHWVRDNYSLPAMFGAVTASIGVICCVIWLINHINRKWQVVDPKKPGEPFRMVHWDIEETMNISRTVAGYSEKIRPPGAAPVEIRDPLEKDT